MRSALCGTFPWYWLLGIGYWLGVYKPALFPFVHMYYLLPGCNDIFSIYRPLPQSSDIYRSTSPLLFVCLFLPDAMGGHYIQGY